METMLGLQYSVNLRLYAANEMRIEVISHVQICHILFYPCKDESKYQEEISVSLMDIQRK